MVVKYDGEDDAGNDDGGGNSATTILEPVSFTVEEDVIRVVFRPGQIGVQLSHEGEISVILRDTQGDRVPGLMKGDLLLSVGGVDTRGMTLSAISKVLAGVPRPAEFVFERHKMWLPGDNGLPALDVDKLKALFERFDTDGNQSLDAEEFANFIIEVHRMAKEVSGKEELTDTFDPHGHAEELIEAHDEDEDGKLDYEELCVWLEQGLRMGPDERAAYALRGGYCPDSIRVIEDISVALHLTAAKQIAQEAVAEMDDNKAKIAAVTRTRSRTTTLEASPQSAQFDDDGADKEGSVLFADPSSDPDPWASSKNAQGMDAAAVGRSGVFQRRSRLWRQSRCHQRPRRRRRRLQQRRQRDEIRRRGES